MKKIVQRLLTLALAVTLLVGCGEAEIARPAVSTAPAAPSQSAPAETAEPEALPAPEETEAPAALESAPPEAPAEETPAPTPDATPAPTAAPTPEPETVRIREDGEYTSKEDVAEYLYLYMHLPGNFITKKEAQALGWDNKKGNLKTVAPGKSIGGDYFGNYEGLLPSAKGRRYTECDIDSNGGYRNSKRIIFSNDGLIYYTEDHYTTFELLYGKE